MTLTVDNSSPDYRIEREEASPGWIQFRLYLTGRKMEIARAEIERRRLGTGPWELDLGWPSVCNFPPHGAFAFATGLAELTRRAKEEFSCILAAASHDFRVCPHPDVPAGFVGWECPRCTLFVMTEGAAPVLANQIRISAGSFERRHWLSWSCDVYAERCKQR